MDLPCAGHVVSLATGEILFKKDLDALQENIQKAKEEPKDKFEEMTNIEVVNLKHQL